MWLYSIETTHLFCEGKPRYCSQMACNLVMRNFLSLPSCVQENNTQDKYTRYIKISTVLLIWTEISQQLFDLFRWNLVQTILMSRGWILLTLVIPWLFLLRHHDNDISAFSWHVLITIGRIAMRLLEISTVPQVSPDISSSATRRSKFSLIHWTKSTLWITTEFGSDQNTCKTYHIPIRLRLVLMSKC